MATFEAQVENLTGIAIESSNSYPTQTQLSIFLQDGVRQVVQRLINLKPEELSKFTTTTNSTTHVAKIGKVLSVMREHDSTSIIRMCSPIPANLRYDASDSNSFAYRSKYNPAFYELDGKIHSIPAAGGSDNDIIVTQVFYDTGVAHTDEVPDNFPEEYAYLVALYAAIKSVENNMAYQNMNVRSRLVDIIMPLSPSSPSL